MQPFATIATYRPRHVFSAPLLEHGQWRLKRYQITLDPTPDLIGAFDDGVEVALRLLPQPAVTALRPGVGYLIQHRGAACDYIVLNWWDQTNEHLTRVLVRPREAGAAWKFSAAQSFCVWDMQLMHHERDAYVRLVLSGSIDLSAYLASRYQQATTG